MDHPGGEDVILEYAGKDITAIMADPLSHEHSKSAYAMMDEFLIGELEAMQNVSTTDDDMPFLPDNATITDDFHPKETDTAKDFAKHHFLDLDKPLLEQMWKANFTKEFYLEQVHIPRHRKEPATLMPFAFLEVFTLTPWYVIPMLWLPIAAVFFFKSVMQFQAQFTEGGWAASSALAYSSTLACYVFGVAFWTFLEYLFHRFLFHMDNYLPRYQVCYMLHFLLHGIHHFLPMDRYRLVMPPVLFAILSFPMLLLAHAVLPTAWANGVIAGSYSMYVVYDTMHYAMHHTRLPEYIRKQKRYHLEHHYKNYELGFGVTSPIWDFVFGTQLLTV
ncbi:fatty acid alpha-hydroxylase [Malassezia pachydermatis]